MGFFQSSDLSSAPPPRLPRCGACGLYRDCKSPRMEPTGKGGRKILVVAEAPGKDEDRWGTQLVGKSGQRLRRSLKKLGVDLDRDTWKTNALICWPADRELSEEQKKKLAMHCRPNLLNAIKDLNPETIVLLGAVAVKSLIGHLWREDVGPIGKWVGWRIPCQELNAWICVTWHPSYLLRENERVLDLWFDRHLEAALGLEGRPWPDGPPDHAGKVQLVHSPAEAARLIRRDGMRREGLTAFDYETNMLKPDGPDARIASCAIAWPGGWTIAYPWAVEAVEATGEYLRGPQPKVAANLKFEQRWTKAILGHGVRNWRHDTMVAAHVLDNRTGVTGLKFQSFVRMGQPEYDSRVVPYLKSDGPGKPNRIDQVPLDSLLRYNALDAHLERELALIQMEEMR